MLKIGNVYKYRDFHGYSQEIFDNPDQYNFCKRIPVMEGVVTVLNFKIHHYENYGDYYLILCFVENMTLVIIEEPSNLMERLVLVC